jgi:uncharacterized caspase-like protein
MRSRVVFLWLVIYLLMISITVGGQSLGGGRYALVIGNAAYASGPLTNPVNDARAIKVALETCGFFVRLLENADRASMLRSVEQLASDLRGADAGLFYYAGHGAQVEGVNYLFPVGEKMEDETDIRTFGLSLDSVQAKMASASPRTVLIFLDACRNNPVSQYFRSGGARGLSSPQQMNTKNALIAYATAPGKVAQDGAGANSPFSQALIKGLSTPGLEINELMRGVVNAVATETKDQQTPWVSNSMREPFYFLDSNAAYLKITAERDKAASELASLQARGAELKAALDQTHQQEERDRIILEQTALASKESLKRIESERLKEEAARFESERDRQAKERELSEAKRLQEEADLARLRALATDAKDSLRRLESANNNLADYFLRYSELLAERKSQQEKAQSVWQSGAEEFERYWTLRFASLEELKSEPWETSQEFQARKASAKGEFDSEKGSELAARKKNFDTTVADLTKGIEQAISTLKADLNSRSYTLKGEDIKISYQAFDPAQKSWPVSVEVLRPSMRFSRQYRQSIAGAKDIGAVYTSIDVASKAGALVGEMDFAIRAEPDGRFVVRVKEFRVVDLTKQGKTIFVDTSAFEPCEYRPSAMLRFEDLSMSLMPANAEAKVESAPDNWYRVELQPEAVFRLNTGERVRLNLSVDKSYIATDLQWVPNLSYYNLDNLPEKRMLPQEPIYIKEKEKVEKIDFTFEAVANFLEFNTVVQVIPGVLITAAGLFVGGLLSNSTNSGYISGAIAGVLINSVLAWGIWRYSGFNHLVYTVDVPISGAAQINERNRAEWENACAVLKAENFELLKVYNSQIDQKNQEIREQNKARGFLLLTPISGNTDEIVKAAYLDPQGQAKPLSKIPRNGLRAEYLFSGNATDSSGNHNDGQLQGAKLTADRKGSQGAAYHFGPNSRIVIPSSASLDFKAGDYSVCAWIKPEKASNGGAGIINKWDEQRNLGWNLGYDVANNRFNIVGIGKAEGFDRMYNCPASTIYPAVPNSALGWTFVTLVRENTAGKIKVYLDGKLAGSESLDHYRMGQQATSYSTDMRSYSTETNAPIYIGYGPNLYNFDTWFRGDIDDVRLYDRALSDNEILALSQE